LSEADLNDPEIANKKFTDMLLDRASLVLSEGG
jgi:hypothetical protein